MQIAQMNAKFKTANGTMAVRDLGEVVSGGGAEDLVQDGTICRIIEESKTGFYDTRFSKNAVSVIMEACVMKDGKPEPTGEAVQVALGMFDRIAVPHVKLADGTVAREVGKDTIRANGSAVADWKKAENAKKFMEAHMGRVMKFNLFATINVRAWDREANAPSKTDLREQKVYTIDWVE